MDLGQYRYEVIIKALIDKQTSLVSENRSLKIQLELKHEELVTLAKGCKELMLSNGLEHEDFDPNYLIHLQEEPHV